jgi:hypothetical protein
MNNSDRIHWEVIPDFGKTKSGVTTFPQSADPKTNENIYLEYDINFESKGEFEVQLLFSTYLKL